MAIFIVIASTTGIFMAKLLMRTPIRIFVFRRGSQIFLILSILIFIFFCLDVSPFTKKSLAAVYVLCSNFFTIAIFVYSFIRKTRESVLFPFSYCPIFASATIVALGRLNLINFPYPSEMLILFGGVLDSIFLTVALADRINVIKNEKTEMQLNNLKNFGNLAIQVGDFINTPLQVISLNVEELKEETDPDALKRGLENIQKQVDAITLKNQTLKKYHQYSNQDKLLKGEEAIPAELL